MRFSDFMITEDMISTEGLIQKITSRFKGKKMKTPYRSAKPQSAPTAESYDAQFPVFERVIAEYLKSLANDPIESITPLVALADLDRIKSSRQRIIPIFKACEADIKAPVSEWLYDANGLGPLERNYNAAIDRFLEIAKKYDFDGGNDIEFVDEPKGVALTWKFVFNNK